LPLHTRLALCEVRTGCVKSRRSVAAARLRRRRSGR
jgi:hypothetical protein